MALDAADDAGIWVDQEVSVRRARGINETHVESALPLRPRVRRLSDSSSILSDIFRHPDLQEETLRRKIKQSNGQHSPKDLVDFFRNTTPPPHNYMSIPDRYESMSDEEQGKWKLGPLKVLQPKKKKPKKARKPRPRSITLPDSAVAGTTIGGHRHIAISIPIEHAHLEYGKATGPTVYRPTGIPEDWTPPPEEQFIETRMGPVRLNSDTRIVTVLKPVMEGRESMETLLHTACIAEEALAKEAELGLPDSPTQTINEILATTPAPARTATPTGPSPLSPTVDAIDEPGAFQHVKRGSGSIPGSPAKIYFPHRRSSLGPSSPDNRSSFDGPSVPRHRRGMSNESQLSPSSLRHSIAESIVTSGSEPVIDDATTAQGYEVSTNRFSIMTNAETVVYTPVAGTPRRRSISTGNIWASPVRNSILGEAPRMPRIDILARAELEQGTAERETENAQILPPLPQLASLEMPVASDTAFPERQASPVRAETPPSGAETLINSIKRPSTRGSLSYVRAMIVAEAEPSSLPASPLPDSPPPSRGGMLRQALTKESLSSLATTVIKVSPPHSHTALSPLSPLQPASGGPTPPESPQQTEDEAAAPPPTIPSRTRPVSRGAVSLDRISLSRRREWAAQREQQRAEAEVLARAQAEAKVARHVQTQTSPGLHADTRTASHRDLARQYDVLREARERDLEARLARLEQSGDTWMATMLPLFEKLNQSLTRIYDSDAAPASTQVESPSSWEDLRRQELAEDYRARQEHERRKMRDRRSAYSPERYDSRDRTSSHHSRPRRHGYDRQPRDDRRATTDVSYGRRDRPAKSQLQVEFEEELARRKHLEALDEAVDARIAELAHRSLHGSEYRATRGRRSRRSSHATSASGLGRRYLDDYGGMARPTNGLDTLEPVMRELTMGGSRLNLEDHVHVDEGEPEELVEYLFEEF
ncbi:hypothetical protein GQ53DRAFT_338744 [Thozetella sp. PMI_491]|nr:hypothetical protein GQ53DRAFT_338744 [Thozetella sp. PMI_491]